MQEIKFNVDHIPVTFHQSYSPITNTQKTEDINNALREFMKARGFQERSPKEAIVKNFKPNFLIFLSFEKKIENQDRRLFVDFEEEIAAGRRWISKVLIYFYDDTGKKVFRFSHLHLHGLTKFDRYEEILTQLMCKKTSEEQEFTPTDALARARSRLQANIENHQRSNYFVKDFSVTDTGHGIILENLNREQMLQVIDLVKRF